MTLDLPPHAVIRPLCLSDIDQIVKLEELGFPPEERCTREKATYRLKTCPELCAGVFVREFHGDNKEGKEEGEDKQESGEHKDNAGDETSRSNNVEDDQVPSGNEEFDRFMPPPRSVLKSERLIGQIIATKMRSPVVTDIAMGIPQLNEETGLRCDDSDERGHHEDGRTIGIHSLVVDPAFRDMHVGSTLMRDYIQRITTQHVADRIALIAHDHLVPFYTKLGFFNEGLSKVELAGGGWNDMWIPLSQTDDDDDDEDTM